MIILMFLTLLMVKQVLVGDYKVLVVDGKKKRRRYLDNYRKRTKNELIEEGYYDEL